MSGQVDEMFTMFYLYNVNASVDCELVVHIMLTRRVVSVVLLVVVVQSKMCNV